MSTLENIAEGDYSHHRENKTLRPFFDELTNISNIFDDILKNNQKIGVKTFFDIGFKVNNESSETYTKEYTFNPTNGVMLKAFKISPLKCSISISTEKIGGRNVCGFFKTRKGISLIDIAYRLDEKIIERYNLAVDSFRIGGDTYLNELQRSKKAIQYAVCNKASKSVFIHELTHWLDTVFDYQIFIKKDNDSEETYFDEWLFYDHESNAIIHQIKHFKKVFPKKIWDNLSMIDLMIILKIPKVFIKKALINHIKSYDKKVGVIRGIDDVTLEIINKKLSKGLVSNSGQDWISIITQKMKDHRIYGKMILKGIDLKFYTLNKEMLYSRDAYLDHYLMMMRKPDKFIDYINFYRNNSNTDQ